MSKIDLDKTWLEVLENEFSMDYMLQIKSKLKDLSKAGTVVCPHPKNIFRALNLTPLPEVKIVILGQDPYHGQGQANGLAFSVSRISSHLHLFKIFLRNLIAILESRYPIMVFWMDGQKKESCY